MRYALGIDGGGSKCEAALVEETGRVVGWGRGGPVHGYYDPPEVISASYLEAVRAALAGVEGAAVWVAGQIPPLEILVRGVGRENRVADRFPTREEDAAFSSAQVEWGLVALSGTGSFVHGRTREGRDLHFGGIGPVLGDYGSAYAIGLGGIRAAYASDWSARRRTSLAEAVPRALGVEDLQAVFHLVYVEQINRRRIATVARAVDEQAEAGDRIAVEILWRAAEELAETAVDLIGRLGLGAGEFPLVLVGGVAQGSRLWRERLVERIAEAAPAARPIRPRLPQAAGAALLALRRMGVEPTGEVRLRLVETYAASAHRHASPLAPDQKAGDGIG